MENRLFRPDLFYRLNSFHIHIPALRERKEDIIPLFYLFLRKYSTALNKPIHAVDSHIHDWLLECPFPGNVRELKHIVERAIILCNGSALSLAHFIKPGKKTAGSFPARIISETSSLDEVEKTSIIRALEKAISSKPMQQPC